MTDVLSPSATPGAAATAASWSGRGAARWTVAPVPPLVAVQAMAAELHLPEDVCRLLLIRGIRSADEARAFLRPRLDQLHDPYGIHGMDAAVTRIERAVRGGELILIHGDYDVDGICSTTLLTRTLRDLGANVLPFIPRRLEDGYDLGKAGVSAAIAANARVVITCDCGTTAIAAIRELASNGIDTIVSDHHLPGSGELPDCLALLNPRQPGCTYADKDLAGVGVAFKLALAVVRRMGGAEGRVLAMLDLVALATVADIASLRGENRILVRLGLRMMRETRNVGLRALLRSAGLAEKPITAGRVGFVLAPRLNALGRLGHAIRGVELLLSESEHEANAIARECEELNRRRQETDRATLAMARETLVRREPENVFGIVLSSDEWHPGVVGIVASRIVEETGRPTVLIAVADGVGKGSGRSIPGFDLHSGLGECADLLMKFGGHRSAAGVTINPESIEAFAERFNSVVQGKVPREDFRPHVRVDLEVALETTDLAAIERLQRHFEPFGQGNPGPVFLSRRVLVARPPRKVGENGIRVYVRAGAKDFELIAWDMFARRDELNAGSSYDIVFRLERDEWNGLDRLQGRLLDFRAA